MDKSSKKLVVSFSNERARDMPMGDGIRKACDKLGYDWKYANYDLRGYKNIIFFENKPSRLKENILHDNGANIGWWMCDCREPKQLNPTNNIKKFTHVFLCTTGNTDLYKKAYNKQVYYMPQHGFELNYIKTRDINWNIIFIGDISQQGSHINRKEIIDELNKFNVKVVSGEKTSKDAKYLYYNTPISLSISMPVPGRSSNRLYNILASCGFALVRYFPGIEHMFDNHKDLVWFHDKKEAKELAGYYLNKPEERKIIAQHGHKKFLEKHRAEHRLQNMLDIMEGNTEDFYGYI